MKVIGLDARPASSPRKTSSRTTSWSWAVFERRVPMLALHYGDCAVYGAIAKHGQSGKLASDLLQEPITVMQRQRARGGHDGGEFTIGKSEGGCRHEASSRQWGVVT
jgi:hypothetical protein